MHPISTTETQKWKKMTIFKTRADKQTWPEHTEVTLFHQDTVENLQQRKFQEDSASF